MATIYINYTTDYGDAPSQVLVSVTDGVSFAFTEEHLPTLAVDGYLFDGWLFAGSLISEGYVIEETDEDIAFTLVAKWTKELNVCGNASGGFGFPKSLVIVDENGNEFTGVVTDEVKVFTATDNDVREGMVYASENGVSTGTKDIPAYRTTAGFCCIASGKPFSIPLKMHDKYDYTKLQCIITPVNTSSSNSVAAEKVVINDAVYQVGSTEKISDVTKNETTKSIDLNIVNDTNLNYYIRYFTYREEE